MLLKLEMKSSDFCALRVFLGGEKTVVMLKPGRKPGEESEQTWGKGFEVLGKDVGGWLQGMES